MGRRKAVTDGPVRILNIRNMPEALHKRFRLLAATRRSGPLGSVMIEAMEIGIATLEAAEERRQARTA